jgi:hypothetical protein
MKADGTYHKRKVKNPKKEIGTHATLMAKARFRGGF